MIYHSSGTLQWYESLADQHRFKSYALGQSAPIAAGLSRVPPFQMVIPLEYQAVTSFKIVSVATGTEYERFSEMNLNGGFATRTFTPGTGTGYKIVVWPGTIAIPGSPSVLPVGRYYAKMSNGVQTFYSEEWEMLNDLSAYYKLEYCHKEDFTLPGIGHIDYRFGYKNWFYLLTEIGKPEYFYDEKVSTRDGANFPIQQIRWKNHKFQVVTVEEICDMLSLVRLHDVVKISRGTRLYELDEFAMDANWFEQGDLAAVDVEFRTDTIVVINGRGTLDPECLAAGDCYEGIAGVPETINCVAVLVEGGTDYNAHQYTTPAGGTVALVAGDKIVVASHSTPEEYTIEGYNGSTYSAFPTSPGDYFWEANTGTYYYDNNGAPIPGSLMTNRIFTATSSLVTGEAIPIGIVELWGLLATGQELLLATAPSDVFTDTGISYTAPDGLVGVRIKVSNLSCANLYTSPWYYFEVFALINCQGDYPSDAAAIADGVGAGEFYCLTIDNVYGMPAAVVKRIDPYTGYSTDAGAIAVLGYDVIYQLAAGNDLGMPSGTCRLAANATPVYLDDAAAAVGGVAVGEFYAYDPIASGFQVGLIKQRKV